MLQLLMPHETGLPGLVDHLSTPSQTFFNINISHTSREMQNYLHSGGESFVLIKALPEWLLTR